MGIESAAQHNKIEAIENGQTEEVVAHLHNHTEELEKLLEIDPDWNQRELAEIRSELSHLDSYPVYREYISGKTPNLTVLHASIEKLLVGLDALIAQSKDEGLTDEDLADELKLRALISERFKELTYRIRKYTNTVAQFQNIKLLKNNGRDVQSQLEKIDHERRRTHNALLDSLKTLTILAQEAQAMQALKAYSLILWANGMDASRFKESESAILVFDPQTLADRNYIRDWALAADFDERLNRAEQIGVEKNPEKK